MNKNVNNPSHYTHIPGIECKDVVKHFNFCCGGAIKYIWRHEYKGVPIQDLQKARELLNVEIERLELLEDVRVTDTGSISTTLPKDKTLT